MHTAFVTDTINSLQSLSGMVDLELHADILTDAWQDAGVSRSLQIDGDLGLKMLHALDTALEAGRPRAVIVGSDAPTLPRAHLDVVLASDADVILGPTDDGGFYAIGCRKTHPQMFAGVRWSVERTLAQTRRAALACGLTVELAPSWFDVDSATDLDRLVDSIDAGARPRATMNWLEARAGKDFKQWLN
jgi:hypothetical protein